MLHALLICVTALIVIEVVAHAVVAIRAPRDAQAPKDERERLIELRAIRVAAYVYAALSMGAVSLLHVGANGRRRRGTACCWPSWSPSSSTTAHASSTTGAGSERTWPRLASPTPSVGSVSSTAR